jgi:hypothetical protein
MVFLCGTPAGRLYVCSGCELLKVTLIGEDGEYEKETRYWHALVAATTMEDWDEDDDQSAR